MIEAEQGGSAAGHGGIDGAFVVESLFDGGEFRVRCKDRRFEVVDQRPAPLLHRPSQRFPQRHRSPAGRQLAAGSRRQTLAGNAAVSELPVGLRGLLIASIFAAGMSTVSTSVTSAATIVLTDYFKPFFRGTTDRHHLAVLRVSSVCVGVLGIIVAIAMLSVESIIDAWWKLSSIFSGGMLGLFLLGCIPQRINRVAAVIGCLCGVAVIAWISLAGLWDLPGLHLHEYLAIVLGTSTIFLIGFLATIAFTRSRS